MAASQAPAVQSRAVGKQGGGQLGRQTVLAGRKGISKDDGANGEDGLLPMATFQALELDHMVINRDNELLEKQFEDMQNVDGATNIAAPRDLPGIESYEQNDAALNTFLIEQR